MWSVKRFTRLLVIVSIVMTGHSVKADSNVPLKLADFSGSSEFRELSNRLKAEDYAWIGERIYQNECAGLPKYLTHWGKGEEFPSMGIGHFIWFPENVNPPFTETFPQMVRFVSKTHPAPQWMQNLKPFKAPWQSKLQFEKAWSEPDLTLLRDWLLKTKAQQAEFIVSSFQQRWRQEIASLEITQRQEIQAKLDRVTSFRKGMFATIDYFNFKGIGLNDKERYQGESWGLVSVLQQMPSINNLPESNEKILVLFVQSAKQRLLLRTQLAPPERNESRWLKGWYKRLDGYLE
ncbi:hypothetical protein [Thiomicrorhabdus sp.]|uniref:hypothetical protein n=1 Tax=Thiomicrorhabdus sp. TaxID=2039724 RepID=UPI0035673E50